MSNRGIKRLRMFAGPNGSGKSSLIRALNPRVPLGSILNPDELFRALQGGGIDFRVWGLDVTWPRLCESLIGAGRLPANHPFLQAGQVQDARLTAPPDVCDAYVAASVADFLREELLASGQSFSFETVMSHPSKIAFFARARAEGYRTYLYFVATDSPEVNLGRIRTRVATGGHAVPEDKVVERYERCLRLVREALPHAYRAFLFDNSGAEMIWLAEYDPQGTCVLQVAMDSLPSWFRSWAWFPEPPADPTPAG
jgi:predicted ABC-type ATPase